MRAMLWKTLVIGLALAMPGMAVADAPKLPERFHRPISTEGLDLRLFDEAVTATSCRWRARGGSCSAWRAIR